MARMLNANFILGQLSALHDPYEHNPKGRMKEKEEWMKDWEEELNENTKI